MDVRWACVGRGQETPQAVFRNGRDVLVHWGRFEITACNVSPYIAALLLLQLFFALALVSTLFTSSLHRSI